ncbi:GNAT family N-acetyltransferase [Wukongibacter baidiensis]|uniref:GNAT family N-acetyltransferase n=1 Tax=Wukongibacter baidiensis TaxID=1723361 RepID=UPI003D7FC3DE
MEYRILLRDEIEGLRDIDRSEEIEKSYYLEDGKLKLKKDSCIVKGWHPQELECLINRLYDLYDNGGSIYGSFDGQNIVGMVALDSERIGKNKDQLKLDILYISSKYRKKGIGRKLVECVKNRAKEIGVSKLYVSATPTQGTVDFYMGVGCELASEINEKLFKLEPEDIHLELEI